MLKKIALVAALLVALTLLAVLVPAGNVLPDAYADELPVFEKVELGADIAPLPTEGRAPYKPNAAGYGEDGLSYRDESINVKIYKARAYDTPVFIAFVQIADASQLRTEQAQRYPSTAVARTDVMARRCNAVIATNADYYVFHNGGIIFRQGELLRNRAHSKYDGLAIDANGDFHLVCPLSEGCFDSLTSPIVNSFCFGPALVVDGEVWDNSDRVVTYKQRMGIGQLDHLCYVMVATDGPEEKNSVGLSIPQFSQLMKDLGAVQAYNLDGGASTSMIFLDAKVNGQQPRKFRNVSDIVYFATAVPDGGEA